MSEKLLDVFLGGSPVDEKNSWAFNTVVDSIRGIDGNVVGAEPKKILPSNRFVSKPKDIIDATQERMETSHCYVGIFSKVSSSSIYTFGQEIGMYKAQKKPLLLVTLGREALSDSYYTHLLKEAEQISSPGELKELTDRFLVAVRNTVLGKNNAYFKVGSYHFDMTKGIAVGENRTVDFSPNETRMMIALLAELDRTVNTAQIVESIYLGNDTVTDYKMKVGGLRHFVNNVNTKMDDEYVESVLHQGYRVADRGKIRRDDPERYREVGAFKIDRLDWLLYKDNRKIIIDPNARRALFFLLDKQDQGADRNELEAFCLGTENDPGKHRVPEIIFRVRKFLETQSCGGKIVTLDRKYYYQQ